MNTYHKGSSIDIEVEFQKREPFDGETRIDPTTPKVTVTGPDNPATPQVNDVDLVQVSTGRYNYTVQTVNNDTWPVGTYEILVTGTSGSYKDRTLVKDGFKLI